MLFFCWFGGGLMEGFFFWLVMFVCSFCCFLIYTFGSKFWNIFLNVKLDSPLLFYHVKSFPWWFITNSTTRWSAKSQGTFLTSPCGLLMLHGTTHLPLLAPGPYSKGIFQGWGQGHAQEQALGTGFSCHWEKHAANRHKGTRNVCPSATPALGEQLHFLMDRFSSPPIPSQTWGRKSSSAWTCITGITAHFIPQFQEIPQQFSLLTGVQLPVLYSHCKN